MKKEEKEGKKKEGQKRKKKKKKKSWIQHGPRHLGLREYYAKPGP